MWKTNLIWGYPYLCPRLKNGKSLLLVLTPIASKQCSEEVEPVADSLLDKRKFNHKSQMHHQSLIGESKELEKNNSLLSI
jgi:hypothetical protein